MLSLVLYQLNILVFSVSTLFSNLDLIFDLDGISILHSGLKDVFWKPARA